MTLNQLIFATPNIASPWFIMVKIVPTKILIKMAILICLLDTFISKPFKLTKRQNLAVIIATVSLTTKSPAGNFPIFKQNAIVAHQRTEFLNKTFNLNRLLGNKIASSGYCS